MIYSVTTPMVIVMGFVDAAIVAGSCTKNWNMYSCFYQLSDTVSTRLHFACRGLVLDTTDHHRERAGGLYETSWRHLLGVGRPRAPL